MHNAMAIGIQCFTLMFYVCHASIYKCYATSQFFAVELH